MESNLHAEALATYRHIINRLDARCTEARLALGNLLRRLGDEKAALEVLEPSLLRSDQEQSQINGEENENCGSDEEEDEDEDEEDDSEESESSNASRSDGFSEWEENDGDVEDESAEAMEAVVGDRVSTTAGMLCNDPNAMRLAFERCKLLDSPSTVDQFLEEACRLLFSDVMQVYSCERPGRELRHLHIMSCAYINLSVYIV